MLAPRHNADELKSRRNITVSPSVWEEAQRILREEQRTSVSSWIEEQLITLIDKTPAKPCLKNPNN